MYDRIGDGTRFENTNYRGVNGGIRSNEVDTCYIVNGDTTNSGTRVTSGVGSSTGNGGDRGNITNGCTG